MIIHHLLALIEDLSIYLTWSMGEGGVADAAPSDARRCLRAHICYGLESLMIRRRAPCCDFAMRSLVASTGFMIVGTGSGHLRVFVARCPPVLVLNAGEYDRL